MPKSRACGNEICVPTTMPKRTCHLMSTVGELSDGLSGFVIVRLSREVGPTAHRKLRRLAEEMKIDSLAELLDELGRPPTRRLVVVNAAGDPLNAPQGYQNSAPTGIDARWAWTQSSECQGIGVVDLEQGWRLSHEDLAARAPTLISGVNHDGSVDTWATTAPPCWTSPPMTTRGMPTCGSRHTSTARQHCTSPMPAVAALPFSGSSPGCQPSRSGLTSSRRDMPRK